VSCHLLLSFPSSQLIMTSLMDEPAGLVNYLVFSFTHLFLRLLYVFVHVKLLKV